MNRRSTKLSAVFPPVGQRIVRSVTAVALSFLVYLARGSRGIPFYTALAVLQCIQPYQESTIQTAKKRATGTFVGAFWGLVLILLEKYVAGGSIRYEIIWYLIIAFFTGVVLYSTVVLRCKNTAYFSCVVYLSVVVLHISDENPFLFVWNRVADTLIGVGLAILVNAVHLPRKKNRDILYISGIDDTIINTNSTLSPYSKIELNRMIADGMKFTVSTRRTPASVREAMDGVHLQYPVIAMDGAVLYDMKESAYLMKYQMTPEEVRRVTGFLTDHGLRVFTNTVRDDLLVIYYGELVNDAEKGIYHTRKRSPYRNYVHAQEQVVDDVVYLLAIAEKEKTEEVYRELTEQSWAGQYRLVKEDSVNYPGYAYIKIYCKWATRAHMLENLKAYIEYENTVTFGSIPGVYDVYIEDTEKDQMVRQLKKLYQPIWHPGKVSNT